MFVSPKWLSWQWFDSVLHLLVVVVAAAIFRSWNIFRFIHSFIHFHKRMRDCICEVIYVVISFYYMIYQRVCYSFEKLSIYFDIIRFVCNLTTDSVFIGMAHTTRLNGHRRKTNKHSVHFTLDFMKLFRNCSNDSIIFQMVLFGWPRYSLFVPSFSTCIVWLRASLKSNFDLSNWHLMILRPPINKTTKTHATLLKVQHQTFNVKWCVWK